MRRRRWSGVLVYVAIVAWIAGIALWHVTRLSELLLILALITGLVGSSMDNLVDKEIEDDLRDMR